MPTRRPATPRERPGGRVAADIAALALLATLACRAPAVPDVGTSQLLAVPAGPDALAPSLAAVPGGGVLVAWTVREDTAGGVRYARLADTTFGPVRTVVRGAPLFVNWADFASVLPLGGDTVVAHWLTRTGDGPFAYGVQLARSADDGVTWQPAGRLHDDASAVEHGFVSLWREPGGGVGTAWLDGRATASAVGVPPDGQGAHAAHDAAGPAMTVRARRVRPDGSADAEAVVDPRSCDCCQTAATPVGEGTLLAWRDRSATEVRDIVVARHTAAGWSPPALVHADGWVTKACPVNGPALASRGDSVVIAWYTQARDTAKVLVAFSTDGGRSFGPPTRADDGAPIGRVGVVRDDAGHAVVSWHEATSRDSADLVVRRVTADGRRSAGRRIARLSATRRAGVSRMVRDGRTIVLAWTVAGDHPTVAAARAPLVAP